MTPERQNKIWAMLTPDEQKEIRQVYNLISSDLRYDNGCNDALMWIFGDDNLTAKVEEKSKDLCEKLIDIGYDFLDKHKSDLISRRVASNVDYSQYRLDLAKEIAVAIITSRNGNPVLRTIAEVAADTANEIVKRLKETENENNL